MDHTLTCNSSFGASTNFSAVAIEPRVSLIPTFYTNEPRGLTEFASLSKCKRSKPNSKTFSAFPNNNLSQKSFNKTMPIKSACDCPNVIVADDDPFQHFYYQVLLQKVLKSEEECNKPERLSMHLCFSGEELIEKMDKGAKCGCDMIRLISIDYQMGAKKLNGVDTSVLVRKDGYKGHLLLRTSETEDSLKRIHKDFDQLLKEKRIMLVNKNDPTFGENFIQGFVKGETRAL